MGNLLRALTLLALSGAIASCLPPVPRGAGTGGEDGGPNGGGGMGTGGARIGTGGNGGSAVVTDAGSDSAAGGRGSGGTGVVDAGGGGTGSGGTGVVDAGSGGTGVVDAGSGGRASDGGTGGTPVDASVEMPRDVLVIDIRPDTPIEVAADTVGGQTFTNVFAIISSGSDNAPGCARCHDGDASTVGGTLPHLLNFTNKTVAYVQLAGAPSIVCAGQEGGAALERVNPGSPDTSVLVQKLRAGLRIAAACGGGGMPANVFVTVDGGGPDGSSSVVQTTHYAITMAQLQTVVDWINAGAPNN